MRRAQQVRRVDLLALVVEDRRLDGPPEELVRVAAEELIQRVLTRHVDREPVRAPPRAPPHLLQRRDRAGERHADRRVQLADVDPQLQRVGRDDAAQLAAREPLLQLTPLVRGVAGTVGSDLVSEVGPLAALQARGRVAQDQLDRLARLDEADRARAGEHEVGEQICRLAQC